LLKKLNLILKSPPRGIPGEPAPPPPTVIGYVCTATLEKHQHYNQDLEKLFYNLQLLHHQN
jgi:hypothetical protein